MTILFNTFTKTVALVLRQLVLQNNHGNSLFIRKSAKHRSHLLHKQQPLTRAASLATKKRGCNIGLDHWAYFFNICSVTSITVFGCAPCQTLFSDNFLILCVFLGLMLVLLSSVLLTVFRGAVGHLTPSSVAAAAAASVPSLASLPPSHALPEIAPHCADTSPGDIGAPTPLDQTHSSSPHKLFVNLNGNWILC